MHDGEGWIDFTGPPDTVKAVPFSRALSGKVPASVFKDRIVVVGAGAPSLNDVHATPMSGRELSTGAEVWVRAAHGVAWSGMSSTR